MKTFKPQMSQMSADSNRDPDTYAIIGAAPEVRDRSMIVELNMIIRSENHLRTSAVFQNGVGV